VNPDTKVQSKHNWVFWFHLCITLLAWVAPFMVSWYLSIPIYLIVWIQFRVFNRCLMNRGHDMDDTNSTFYSYLLNQIGIPHNELKLLRFVRNELYLVLGGIALIWQVLLGIEPLFF
jgi:hypothetical protein